MPEGRRHRIGGNVRGVTFDALVTGFLITETGLAIVIEGRGLELFDVSAEHLRSIADTISARCDQQAGSVAYMEPAGHA